MDWMHKKVALAGRFYQYTRDELSTWLVLQGAVMGSYDGACTDVLVYGARPGRVFFDATMRTILTISEDDFVRQRGILSKSRTMNERLEELRGLIHQVPSAQGGELIMRALHEWPDDEGVEVGVEYVARAFSKWPTEYCRSTPHVLMHLAEKGHNPRARLIKSLHLAQMPSKNLPSSSIAIMAHAHETMPRLESVTFGAGDGAYTRELLDHPVCAQLKTLNLGKISRDGLIFMAHHKGFAHLHALELRGTDFEEDGAHMLVHSPVVANLKKLDLYGPGFGDRGVRALARTTCMHNLEHLSLVYCEMTHESFRDLMGAPCAKNLKHFNAKYNECGASACTHLAQAAHVDRLEHLDLSANEVGDDGIMSLASSMHLSSLKTLVCEGNQENPLLTHESAQALASSVHLSGLERLELGRNLLGDEGFYALMRSPHLTHIKHLDLSSNRITYKGLRVLLEPSVQMRPHTLILSGNNFGNSRDIVRHVPLFEEVRELRLERCRMYERDLMALVENPGIRNVRALYLQLHSNTLYDSFMHVLAKSTFPCFEHISLMFFELSTKAARAIASSSWFAQLHTFKAGKTTERGLQYLKEVAVDLPVHVLGCDEFLGVERSW